MNISQRRGGRKGERRKRRLDDKLTIAKKREKIKKRGRYEEKPWNLGRDLRGTLFTTFQNIYVYI